MKTPIFIFSLPRAGSTLLQRMLMAHPEICSHAEPWILLPLCRLNKSEGAVADYGYSIGASAISEFTESLPNGSDDFYKELRKFSDSLYTKHCKNDERFFLDKTPRYYYIINEIKRIYPDAKFIFLFRNPVHVMSSMINTWSNGNLKGLYAYKNDLCFGPVALSEGFNLLKSNSIAINYENLVSDPNRVLNSICHYLDIKYYDSMCLNFSKQVFNGRMGDPTGVSDYTSVSIKTLDKWKLTFNTHVRKKLIKKYISSMDEKVLEVQGYDKSKILQDIDLLNSSFRGCFTDIFHFLYCTVVLLTKANIFFG